MAVTVAIEVRHSVTVNDDLDCQFDALVLGRSLDLGYLANKIGIQIPVSILEIADEIIE